MAQVSADEFLVEKARRGDQDAFSLLYESYRDRVFGFLYRLSGSTDLAEVMTHDCFLRFVKESEQTRTDRKIPLRLRLYSTARKLGMEYLLNSDHQFSQRVEKGDGDAIRNETETLEAKVQNAVLSLPFSEREVLILGEYEGFALNEIADVLQTDDRTVSDKLRTARRRLSEMLASYLPSRQ